MWAGNLQTVNNTHNFGFSQGPNHPLSFSPVEIKNLFRAIFLSKILVHTPGNRGKQFCLGTGQMGWHGRGRVDKGATATQAHRGHA